MRQRHDVTAVLITYNRADLLGPAIDGLLAQSGPIALEVIVVDNNSTDHTRRVIESRMNGSGGRLRYIFEPRQGISFARNAGIAGASSEIVAFTDDDVRVAEDWAQVIHQSLTLHPEIDCVAGRILPVWSSPVPGWLRAQHWVGPLALQDYGEEPFAIDSGMSISLAGANFAFRRRVFDRIGGFAVHYQRAEDSEFLLRFWRSGGRALYVPAVTVYAAVQPERLTKSYYRAWHAQTGSLTRLAEEGSAARCRLRDFSRLMGIPRFAFAELALEAVSWLANSVRGRESNAFWHECQVRELVAYMRRSRTQYRRGPTSRAPARIAPPQFGDTPASGRGLPS